MRLAIACVIAFVAMFAFLELTMGNLAGPTTSTTKVNSALGVTQATTTTKGPFGTQTCVTTMGSTGSTTSCY